MSSQIIVAGIDVGGRAKGFHAVPLCAGGYLDQIASCHVTEVADWCRQITAQSMELMRHAVGVIRVVRVLQSVN